MSNDTTCAQESADEPLSIEEIAFASTRELLWDAHHDASDSVTTIAAGLLQMYDEDPAITADVPTEREVDMAIVRCRDLADLLETRVKPLVAD